MRGWTASSPSGPVQRGGLKRKWYMESEKETEREKRRRRRRRRKRE
jgi:hypothetical protein